jgi:hypothetical protein
MSLFHDSAIIGASGSGGGAGYSIERSLRFNSSDSAYLSRTPASAGNRKTWTWAGWVKLAKTSFNNLLECVGPTTPGTRTSFMINDLDKIDFFTDNTSSSRITTTQVFRDYSAWYHIVLAVDTIQATASNRVKIYVNGSQITTFSTATYPSQNLDTQVNNTQLHTIGRVYDPFYANMYLADVHLIDGQALDPTSFGEFDDNGVWQPKAFSGGSYGTNGFHLDFSDNSTAAALGTDTSGNGNTWTVNNFSVQDIARSDVISAVSSVSAPTFSSTLSKVGASENGEQYDAATNVFTNSGLFYGSGRGGSITWSASSYGLSGYLQVSGSGASWRLDVNGVEQTNKTGTNYYSSISTIQLVSLDGDNDVKLNAINLNGVRLINGMTLQKVDLASASGLSGSLLLQQKLYQSNGGANGTVYSIQTSPPAIRFSATTGTWVASAGHTIFAPSTGSGNDSLVDVPTNGSEVDTGAGGQVRGNYCTLNPLTSTSGTYSQGNLRFVGPSAYRRSNGSIAVSTGKWYWEVTLGNGPVTPRISTSQWNAFGFGLSTAFGSTTNMNAVTDALVLQDNGYYKNFSGSNTDGGTAFSSGDVLSIAVDLDANTFTFRRNNTQIVTGTIGGTAGRELVPVIISYDGQYGVMDCNFGQRPFAYTAPSGFKALCTANLPAPVVTKPSTVMDVALWTSTTSITMNMSPDLVWMKRRNSSGNHALVDTVRTNTKHLETDSTNAEQTESTPYISSFNSNGFSLSSGTIFNNGNSYVAWCWDAGSSTVTNTAGSITSQVRANASAGFSIVTYTGAVSSPAKVGHGLNATPAFVIVKPRSTSDFWVCYHSAFNDLSKYIVLNSTNAVGTAASNYWGTSSDWNSSTFGIYPSAGSNNNLVGVSHVAYCFAPVAGYSSFGSYTGNGQSGDSAPFIWTGFRPRWVLTKASSSTGLWNIHDTQRSNYNPTSKLLWADSSSNEVDYAGGDFTIDCLSNGFKARAATASLNSSGVTYVWAAFAESPFQYARAR